MLIYEASNVYLDYQKWIYFSSIPNVSKIIIILNKQERDELFNILNNQSSFLYYFIDFNLINSEKMRYISNSVYYSHINQNNSIEAPMLLYKKFLALPLASQNNFFSNQHNIYLIGKIETPFLKLPIDDLPIGSTVLRMGHQEPDKTLPIVYRAIQLSFFQNDNANIYMNFIHLITLSPLSKIITIKTNNNIAVFESSFCPLITEDVIKRTQLKQIKDFIDFFYSAVNSNLSAVRAVQEFLEFITKNLSDSKQIENFVNKTCNIKQYETLMLFGYIVSNASNSIDDLIKVMQTPINKMILDSYSALHIAVTHANLDIVKLLISYGANTDHIDIYNNTPFIAAIKNHKSDIVDYFHNTLDFCINIENIGQLNTGLPMNVSDFLCVTE